MALCVQVVALCERLTAAHRDGTPSTSHIVPLLENIRRRKPRVKCLADISKMLQRCRAQSIYFVQLRSYTTRTYTANTGATRDVDTFPITTIITMHVPMISIK